MQTATESSAFVESSSGDSLFERIASDIASQGFSINKSAMPESLLEPLWHHQQHIDNTRYQPAGVGRRANFQRDKNIRSDEICWINGDSPAGHRWLVWTNDLREYLNRRLFLGLFSFESHFAHYAPGAFYAKHVDAFRGQANRILTVVMYLNKNWQPSNGGELVLYTGDDDAECIKVLPEWGTIVVFLSEEFPHEVLPASRSRSSIAGWYRLNTSSAIRVDPAL